MWLFEDSVLRLDVVWVSTEKDLYLVQVGALVIAHFAFHAFLYMGAL